MSVVDFLLNSLVKYLQKKQKVRKKRKKAKQRASKKSRLARKIKTKKKFSVGKKRTKKSPVKTLTKQPAKKKKITRLSSRKTKKKNSSRGRKVNSNSPKIRLSPKRSASKKGKGKTGSKIQKTAKQSSADSALLKENCIGEITHYFSRIKVVVLKMNRGKLHIGDKIHIKGLGKGFPQKVKSLQIESVDVKIARKGQLVGLKVGKAAKAGDKVYKLVGSFK